MDNHISSRALLHRRDVIKSNPRFGEAILEHYTINDTIYKKQPLFYKTMLQESRFNIILSMCCFIFGNQAESVSEIKELCSRYTQNHRAHQDLALYGRQTKDENRANRKRPE